MRTFLIAAIAVALPLGAYATGKSSPDFNAPVDRITGTIQKTTYDGSIFLGDENQQIEVAIGIPAFITSRGLPLTALAPGKSVTVDAYDSASDSSDRLYALRISIDGRVVDLRT